MQKKVKKNCIFFQHFSYSLIIRTVLDEKKLNKLVISAVTAWKNYTAFRIWFKNGCIFGRKNFIRVLTISFFERNFEINFGELAFCTSVAAAIR